MGNVVDGEGAAFAALQPLLADLIAADVKIPDFVLASRNLYVQDWNADSRGFVRHNFAVLRLLPLLLMTVVFRGIVAPRSAACNTWRLWPPAVA